MRSAIERDPARDKGKIFFKKKKEKFYTWDSRERFRNRGKYESVRFDIKKSGEIEHRDSQEVHDRWIVRISEEVRNVAVDETR